MKVGNKARLKTLPPGNDEVEITAKTGDIYVVSHSYYGLITVDGNKLEELSPQKVQKSSTVDQLDDETKQLLKDFLGEDDEEETLPEEKEEYDEDNEEDDEIDLDF